MVKRLYDIYKQQLCQLFKLYSLVNMKGEKQKTSIFSEYVSNENDSISSRELEFWLKQTAPVVQPKLGIEWTLMSTNSIFEQDEHLLIRNDTFESLHKENDFNAFNTCRESSKNHSFASKSKSYVNAMVDLQSKVKILEKENQSLKASLRMIKDERNRSMSESSHMTEQLKNRIQALEPKTKRLEEVVKENKKLRDWKDENIKKMKLMEKNDKLNLTKIAEYQKELNKMKQISQQMINKNEADVAKASELLLIIDKLKEQKLKLQQKNKKLEDMKQKSTTSILQKLGGFIDQNQHLKSENKILNDELSKIKIAYNDKFKELQQKYDRQSSEYINTNQKLAQQNNQKKETIICLTKQANYFKQCYEKTNYDLIEMLKKHSQDLKQARQKQWEMKKQRQIIYIEPKREIIDINKQSIIKNHLQDDIAKNQIQSQLQFQNQDNEIEQEEEIQVFPKHQTRSVIQSEKVKVGNSVAQVKNNQSDTLSQEHYRPRPITHSKQKITRRSEVKNTQLKRNSKDKQIEKTKEKDMEIQQSKLKEKSKEKPKQRSRQKAKKIEKNLVQSQEHSFILKSHQPLTHHQEPQYLYYTEEQDFNSANAKNKIPYYWDSNEVAEFGTPQGNSAHNYNQNNLSNEYNLQRALLNELNREAVRLIEQQQKLLNSNNQMLSPTERSENIGRMKQLNEQIRTNNEKIIEIKQKINGH